MYSIAVVRHALTLRSKGQGHTDTKTVTVTWLPVTVWDKFQLKNFRDYLDLYNLSDVLILLRPCAAAAGVGLHVDTTAYVF